MTKHKFGYHPRKDSTRYLILKALYNALDSMNAYQLSATIGVAIGKVRPMITFLHESEYIIATPLKPCPHCHSQRSFAYKITVKGRDLVRKIEGETIVPLKSPSQQSLSGQTQLSLFADLQSPQDDEYLGDSSSPTSESSD